MGEVAQAGAFVKHQGIGRWWAAIPKNKWPAGDEFEKIISAYWSDDYGDRRQEIVFIGLVGQMDETDLRQRLDAALVRDYLEDGQGWDHLDDPFPKWLQQAA